MALQGFLAYHAHQCLRCLSDFLGELHHPGCLRQESESYLRRYRQFRRDRIASVPVIFVTPWPEWRQYAAVLGTLGMKHMRVTVCVKEQWVDLCTESSTSSA
jgi:hypothetical protein